MGIDAVVCTIVLIGVFAGLIKNHPPDALLLGAVILVSVLGIITPEEALAGFSNKGMLTVAALYIIAAALKETGAIAMVGSSVLGSAHYPRAGLLRLAAFVTPLSAILNNTPIVAMFIPAVVTWCKGHRIAASRLLLPLSYLCILGARVL
ncbi:SLC13 family permease [Planctomycetota bacterium]